MKIEIKHRATGTVLFTHEAEENTVAKTLAAGADSRADLSWADLSGADLSGAYMNGEILNKAPVSIANLRWPVLISEGFMKIGYQRHTHQEWANFNDEEIANMAPEASAFWAQWREPLLTMCAAQVTP